ncbi:hypothetical protein [Streptomyces sp. C10-9-1]|uniref:hypothetical protein n=1 Tax=Streptomyces sp. C10-9-1 TaxID=1859285 RepID=UPI003F4A797F
MDPLIYAAGAARLSPVGECVFLLLMGAFSGLVGWGLVLNRTGFGESMVQYGNQMQGDFRESCGRSREVTPGEDRARRLIVKSVGWVFAVVEPVLVVAGVARLIVR